MGASTVQSNPSHSRHEKWATVESGISSGGEVQWDLCTKATVVAVKV